MCLATMPYVYTASQVCVIIFSTGGKFQLLSNFTELHNLTPATRSYEFLFARTITKVPSTYRQKAAMRFSTASEDLFGRLS